MVQGLSNVLPDVQMMSQSQMPYPAYLRNDLSTILTFVLPLFAVLSFAFIGNTPHPLPLSGTVPLLPGGLF
jgi:hypothetical protein